jgi:hypothetical protein
VPEERFELRLVSGDGYLGTGGMKLAKRTLWVFSKLARLAGIWLELALSFGTSQALVKLEPILTVPAEPECLSEEKHEVFPGPKSTAGDELHARCSTSPPISPAIRQRGTSDRDLSAHHQSQPVPSNFGIWPLSLGSP